MKIILAITGGIFIKAWKLVNGELYYNTEMAQFQKAPVGMARDALFDKQ